MQFTIEDIRIKLNNYFHQEISKNELGEWAKEAYHDLFKGGYLEIDKLTCYPFIKVLSTFHLEEDDIRGVFPCDIEEVASIRDILSGKINKSFSIDIGFAWSLNPKEKGLNVKKREIYKRIATIIKKYSNGKSLEKKDIEECRLALTLKEENRNTIQYILDCHIKSFIRDNIEWDDECFEIQQSLWLFINKKQSNDELLNKAIKYLECYIGERNIGVEILFTDGNVNVFYSI